MHMNINICFPIIALRSLFCSSSVSKVDSFTGNYFIFLYDKNSDVKFRVEFICLFVVAMECIFIRILQHLDIVILFSS